MTFPWKPEDAPKLREAHARVVDLQNVAQAAQEVLQALGDPGLHWAGDLNLAGLRHACAGVAENLERYAASAAAGGWPPPRRDRS